MPDEKEFMQVVAGQVANVQEGTAKAVVSALEPWLHHSFGCKVHEPISKCTCGLEWVIRACVTPPRVEVPNA